MAPKPVSPGTAPDAVNPPQSRPWPVLPAGGDRSARAWPLHERAAAQAAEAAALASAPPFTLMARAGLAVARLARALAPHARQVLVLAGPGHNGGDGLVAARCLHQAGVPVRVHLAANPDQLPADAARAWREAREAGVAIEQAVDADSTAPAVPGVQPSTPPDLLIDALLGLGARRAPSGAVATVLAAGRTWAAQGVPVLAVDLPSGLHPDTGQPLGTAQQVLPATATLCLLTLRPGCFTGHGRDLAGAVWFDDLGCGVAGLHGPTEANADAITGSDTVSDTDTQPTAWLTGPAPQRLAPHAAHKGSQGDVAVVGGTAGMTGAAWLAASAALAAGAGRVYLGLLDPSAVTLNPQRPELMLRPRLWTAAAGWLPQCTVVAGCGGGQDIAAALPPLLAQAGRLVLDADALNAVAADPALLAQLQLRAARGAPTVLTPHPLEAARLLGLDTAAVQADRLEAARQLARRMGAVVVLKGSGSVVASPSGLTHVNPSGNASLATAGTGDVLAGWLGGRWASQPSTLDAPTHSHELLALVATAVWQHGAAADRHRAQGHAGPLLAGALISQLQAPGH